MTKILSIPEANLHQQFVMDAIQRIEKLKVSIFSSDFSPDLVKVNISNLSSPQEAKLLDKETSPSKPNDVEVTKRKWGEKQEGVFS